MNVSHEGRIGWPDTAKGIGIVLVVVGHTINGLAPSALLADNSMFQIVDAWIYAFHMPLFFFLSGLFIIKSSEEKSFLGYVTEKLRTIAYPYLVWSVAIVILKSLLGSIPNVPRKIGDLFLIFYQPVEQFWFLYVLFFLLIIFRFFYLGVHGIWAFTALAVLVNPACTPLSGIVVLDEMRFNAIYLALGAVFSLYLLRDSAFNWRTLLLVALAGSVGVTGSLILRQSALLAAGAALAGIAASVALSMLVEEHFQAEAVRYLGRHSLEIFVLHSIVSATVRVALVHNQIWSPWIHLWLEVAFGVLAPLYISKVFRYFGINFAFTLRTDQTEVPISLPAR